MLDSLRVCGLVFWADGKEDVLALQELLQLDGPLDAFPVVLGCEAGINITSIDADRRIGVKEAVGQEKLGGAMMKEPLSSHMKVGIVHFMAFPETMRGEGPVFETISKIVEDEFFAAIEVTWIKDEEQRWKVRSLLETSHLIVGFGGQPPLLINKLDLNSKVEAQRRQAIDQMKASVDQAYELGAGKLGFLSGKDPGEADRAEATRLLVDSIVEICRYAKDKGGLQIVLETFDIDIDKKCLIGPSVEASKVAKMVKSQCQNFGIMMDLSHLPMLGESPEPALTAVKDHLIHIHIGNCLIGNSSHPAYGDAHPRFGLKGGENDVPELAAFLRALFKVGYLGQPNGCPGNDGKQLPVVSFEVKPMAGETSEAVIAAAKRVLIEAWAVL